MEPSRTEGELNPSNICIYVYAFRPPVTRNRLTINPIQLQERGSLPNCPKGAGSGNRSARGQERLDTDVLGEGVYMCRAVPARHMPCLFLHRPHSTFHHTHLSRRTHISFSHLAPIKKPPNPKLYSFRKEASTREP